MSVLGGHDRRPQLGVESVSTASVRHERSGRPATLTVHRRRLTRLRRSRSDLRVARERNSRRRAWLLCWLTLMDSFGLPPCIKDSAVSGTAGCGPRWHVHPGTCRQAIGHGRHPAAGTKAGGAPPPLGLETHRIGEARNPGPVDLGDLREPEVPQDDDWVPAWRKWSIPVVHPRAGSRGSSWSRPTWLK